MLSMVVSLVLQRLDFGNATLVGLPAYQLSRLSQSVLNVAARLVFSRSKYDHVTPLLHELHWLSVLVFRCLDGLVPSYLSRDPPRVSVLVARRRLRSSSTSTLVVPPTRQFSPTVTALSLWLRCGHRTSVTSIRYLHWRPLGVS